MGYDATLSLWDKPFACRKGRRQPVLLKSHALNHPQHMESVKELFVAKGPQFLPTLWPHNPDTTVVSNQLFKLMQHVASNTPPHRMYSHNLR